MCIDRLGRYDGPARGAEMRGGQEIRVEGAYRTEAPTGRWVCSNAATGERLELRFDAERWARTLWGIDLAAVPGAEKGRHLGVAPLTLCPEGDWSTPDFDAVDDAGLVVTAHTPPRR